MGCDSHSAISYVSSRWSCPFHQTRYRMLVLVRRLPTGFSMTYSSSFSLTKTDSSESVPVAPTPVACVVAAPEAASRPVSADDCNDRGAVRNFVMGPVPTLVVAPLHTIWTTVSLAECTQ